MSRDINSFDKLKEIESELDSLKALKKQVKEENLAFQKPAIDINRLLLESINKTCMQMELELNQVASDLKQLVKLFRAAMEGKSPEELEENKEEDKIKKLVEQNEELLKKLNTITRNMNIGTDYSTFDTLSNRPSLTEGEYFQKRTL